MRRFEHFRSPKKILRAAPRRGKGQKDSARLESDFR